MSSRSPGPEQQALIEALQAEYAAVFAYGIVAAFSNTNRADLVASNTAAHRARRDATLDALAAADVDAPEPEAGYTIPFAVSDPVSAAQLAAQIESDTAVAWRSVIERSQSEHTREVGVTALTEAAVRAGNWRAILGVAPATTAFPGQP
ncbi:uncharacterized protein DUF4439 [Rhodococcus sp. OK519]|uniref:ferritin-like domain-containing protein n=1 Tax=Rhodococcus sp. OK519 TaxID=2135729 RepID=UPI000D338A99|nr:uncharacterized protein DUF4439 [Rhodococcus sp. OK519]